MLHLYDTATREVRELALREPGSVSIYLCGPTVYGPPHLGHGRATLVYDVLRRYLEWTGLDVRLVSNVTDIDDAIINRANNENRPWQDITAKCESVWFEAMMSCHGRFSLLARLMMASSISVTLLTRRTSRPVHSR